MPLSELLPAAARRKHGPFLQPMAANCSSDLSPLGPPDQEFMELLWENGQIIMQGQSHRTAKGSSTTSLQNSAGKRNLDNGALSHLGFSNQDPEMLPPWPNYPIDDFSLDFLPDFPPHDSTSLPATVPADSSVEQAFSPSRRTQNPDDPLPFNGPDVANFSHFLRPPTSLRSFDSRACENASTAASSNPVESTLIDPVSCPSLPADKSSSFTHPKRKKKGQEGDDYECHSEDVEDESKKLSPSAKRSRAAEVHNQSERRRRDRINEKLKALQELIPNCNKVDKASVLDEAIEYLKTLQMQLQIMSMGGGIYMSPMMVPPRMPVGMGMGMGFGMGMINPNGSPLVPPRPNFPFPVFPPAATRHGMRAAPPMPIPRHPTAALPRKVNSQPKTANDPPPPEA